MDNVNRILHILNNPESIAWCQYYCGVRWVGKDASNVIYPVKETRKSVSSGDVLDYKDLNYVIHNRTLYWLAKAGSELAGESFYYVFFPACSWIFDIRMARQTLVMFSMAMYVGQALKDVLKYPRPSSPPVVRLEKAYETEFGMPSTHTVCAATASFSVVLFTSFMEEISPAPYYLAAFVWTSSVMLSRVYLGMHSFLDLLAGVSLSGLMMCTLHPLAMWMEECHISTSYSFLSSMLIILLTSGLSTLMFHLDTGIDEMTHKKRWSTARGDTAEILGWLAGYLIGSRYAVRSSIIPSHLSEDFPALQLFCRFICGSLILGPTTFLVRKLLTKLCLRMNGITNEKEGKRTWTVELPYKYVTTACSAFLSTVSVPLLLRDMGLW